MVVRAWNSYGEVATETETTSKANVIVKGNAFVENFLANATSPKIQVLAQRRYRGGILPEKSAKNSFGEVARATRITLKLNNSARRHAVDSEHHRRKRAILEEKDNNRTRCKAIFLK